MEKNFAERLDSIYSVFNSKDTALYDEATQELRTLVKESYETHINIIRHKENGMWCANCQLIIVQYILEQMEVSTLSTKDQSQLTVLIVDLQQDKRISNVNKNTVLRL